MKPASPSAQAAAERTVRGPIVPTSNGGPPGWSGGGPTGSIASVSFSPAQIRFSRPTRRAISAIV